MNVKENRENCTIMVKPSCEGCRCGDRLECRISKRALRSFMRIGFPPAVATMAGLALAGIFAGQWWMLIAYTLFTFGMIGAVEMMFLCRHCPYYALEGRTIVCIGNYGSLKLLPYSPYPMNGLERFLMRAFVALSFLLMPLAGMVRTLFLLSGNLTALPFLLASGLTALALFFCLRFIIVLKRDICTGCVNFSCLLNRVPKETVDSYLKKNPLMRAAWEEKGYIVAE